MEVILGSLNISPIVYSVRYGNAFDFLTNLDLFIRGRKRQSLYRKVYKESLDAFEHKAFPAYIRAGKKLYIFSQARLYGNAQNPYILTIQKASESLYFQMPDPMHFEQEIRLMGERLATAFTIPVQAAVQNLQEAVTHQAWEEAPFDWQENAQFRLERGTYRIERGVLRNEDREDE